MLPPPADFLHRMDIRPTFFSRLQQILHSMDQAYEEVAAHYGFRCAGCEQSCCRTRFYHHTYLEYLYLFAGFERLDGAQRSDISKKADLYCRALADAQKQGVALQMMCPLNFDHLCSLYEYRPLICRLHGIPHSLRSPGRGAVLGPGCDAFHRQCGQPGAVVLDRTPHYVQLAGLESEFRQTLALTQRIKMTVAEMILHF